MEFHVKVSANASVNRVEGFTKGAGGENYLKVRLTCTPQGGKANAALITLLARYFDVPASDLSIVSGARSRYKRIESTNPIDFEDKCTD